MDIQDKVINRVKKLLAIANDEAASEHEILNAMTHAQEIIDKHNLSEEDLSHEPQDDYTKVDNSEFGTSRSYVGGKFFAWEHHLALYVQDLVGCKCYCNHSKVGDFARTGKSYIFYGIQEDVELASSIYNELRLTISTMAIGLYQSVYKGDGGVYCQGFIKGLNENLKSNKNKEVEIARTKLLSNQTTAMILIERRNDLVQYKQNKADKWLKESKGIKIRKGSGTRGASGSSSSYNQGFLDGKNTDVNVGRTRKLT